LDPGIQEVISSVRIGILAELHRFCLPGGRRKSEMGFWLPGAETHSE
jgi:hypothetical protein